MKFDVLTRNEAVFTFRQHYFNLSRNRGEDWSIEVTGPDDLHSYDGYWRDSARKTVKSAIVEACKGSLLEPPKKWPSSITQQKRSGR